MNVYSHCVYMCFNSSLPLFVILVVTASLFHAFLIPPRIPHRNHIFVCYWFSCYYVSYRKTFWGGSIYIYFRLVFWCSAILSGNCMFSRFCCSVSPINFVMTYDERHGFFIHFVQDVYSFFLLFIQLSCTNSVALIFT